MIIEHRTFFLCCFVLAKSAFVHIKRTFWPLWYTMDCGLYAIAFATAILNGEDPTRMNFLNLRSHFQHGIESRSISPFPSSHVYRERQHHREVTVNLICTCRLPDDGKLVMECKTCYKRYHGRCVGIRS